ncbi:MAG: hypothetical protein ACI8V2_003236 [Candidatus Latescibacterota bacterium]|jgi:hypothetical protein
MFRQIFSACLLGCVLVVSSADAGDQGRIGTAAAQELRIPTGSRGTALGGAILASVDGVEAMYWNPSGVVFGSTKREVLFSYLDYMADMNMNYFAVTTKLRDDIAVGVSAKVFSVGDIFVTTEEAPEGTGEVLNPTFSTVSFTYSQMLTDRVSFGTTIKYIHEGIKRESANGLAFDFGFQYKTALQGLTLAIAMRNFGPDLRFDGLDLDRNVSLSDAIPSADPQATQRVFRTSLASAELPTSVEIGIAYDFLATDLGNATFSATFRNNNLATDEYQAGIEYDVRQMLQLRGGYAVSALGGTSPNGFNKEYILGPSFGFGLNVPMGGNERSFRVDYAYGKTQFFQDNHWLTVGMGF